MPARVRTIIVALIAGTFLGTAAWGQTYAGWTESSGTTSTTNYVQVGTWSMKPSDMYGVKASVGGDLFVGVSENGTQPLGRMRLTSNLAEGFVAWNLYYGSTGGTYGYKVFDSSRAAWDLSFGGTDRFLIRRFEPGTGFVTATTIAEFTKTQVNFNVPVRGTNIQAHYQDVAEWVPSANDLQPGTVVVLNVTKTNEVMASSQAYDSAVAGVVSPAPGLILGEEGDAKEMIATTGRVKVRVDARMRPVKVGDLLTTSDLPGAAMASEPVTVGGVKMHRPGTILGKALEPLPDGIGEILVLLTLQ